MRLHLRALPLFITLLSFALALSGCYDAFSALEPRDGGASDARAVAPSDASAADGGGDAGRACTGEVRWIDPAPQVLPSTEGPLEIAGAADRFDVVYLRGEPSACDGPCVVGITVSSRGAFPSSSDLRPFYWARDQEWLGLGMPGRVIDARRGSGEQTIFVARDQDHARWQLQPATEGSIADGTFEAEGDPVIGDVLVSRGGAVLVETHTPVEHEPFSGDRYSGMQVRELVDDGVITHDIDTFGFEFDEPRLVMGRGATRAYVTFTQSWDFPTTVQIREVAGERQSLDGSSCGVVGYDAAAYGDDEVLVLQQCVTGGELQLQWHTFTEGRRETQIVVHDFGGTAPASRARVAVAPDGLVWVAFATPDDRVHVQAYTIDRGATAAGFARVVDAIAPAAPELTGDRITGLALAVADDGAVAVGWSGVSPEAVVGGYPRAAIARFARCE